MEHVAWTAWTVVVVRLSCQTVHLLRRWLFLLSTNDDSTRNS